MKETVLWIRILDKVKAQYLKDNCVQKLFFWVQLLIYTLDFFVTFTYIADNDSDLLLY